MSTYTIAFQCGHIHNDACQQCEENTDYTSPDSCPQCLYTNFRMPSFGTLPDVEFGDDDDDDGADEDQDVDTYYEEDDLECDYESDEDISLGGEQNNDSNPVEALRTARTALDSASRLTIVTNLESEDLQNSKSPIDRELPNYICIRSVVISRPAVVVRRTRCFSELSQSAQIEEVSEDE